MKRPSDQLTVTLFWHEEPLESAAFTGDARVRVGSARGASFLVPASRLPADYLLFERRHDLTTLQLVPGMRGSVRVANQEMDAAKMAGEAGDAPFSPGQVRAVALNPGDSGSIWMDVWEDATIDFEVEPVRREDRVGRGFGAFDRAMALSLAGTVLAMAAFLLVMVRSGPGRAPVVLAARPPPVKMIPILQKLVEDRKKEEEERRKREEERKKRQEETAKRPVVRGDTPVEVAMQKMNKRERAQEALRALEEVATNVASDRRLDSLFSDMSSADQRDDDLGTLASALPESDAGFGLGVGGAGTAGGGGGLGTRGGALLRAGGNSLGKLGARQKQGVVGGRVQKAPVKKVTVEGSIDKAQVLKVIDAHMGRIRNCYERELLAMPDLEGKLTFEWVIGPDGRVTTVRVAVSTMKGQGVANCIKGVIQGWTFPAPAGGSVTVVYPFIFNAAGF